jgi:hypothetical protein
MYFQTRPEKQAWNIASQEMRIVGTGEALDRDSMWSGFIRGLEP